MSLAAACGPNKRGNGNGDGGNGTPDACVGLQCQVVDCAKMGMPPTSISGTAFAPNGTLPLYNVTVYVPNTDPGQFPQGVSCDRCVTTLPGEPVAFTTSDEHGHFQLNDVPVGAGVPLILTVGKWRRTVVLPNVTQCTDNPLPATVTSLPKNGNEGSLPQMAISTGSWDALECLVRKLGVSDSEFTLDTGTGHVHMYQSDVTGGGATGATHFGNDTAHPFAGSSKLWGSLDQLKKYDILLFSCEGSPDVTNKPKTAMDNLKQFADLGGRVFLEHYHSEWLTGDPTDATHAPAVWPTIATFGTEGSPSDPSDDLIDQTNNPKGTSFASWLVNVGASSTLGHVSVSQPRQTAASIDNSKATRWIYQSESPGAPQSFQFTTPNEGDPNNRCGKVVFSDMHVAGDSTSDSFTGFPGGCVAGDLTPQEKALAFMFFDIASCVQVIQ